MLRNLHLTTPLLHGPDVEQLQELLTKAGYLHAQADGQFGPLTAQAVYRAKYWFGYLKPDQVAGPVLYDLLLGKSKPTLAMRLLAEKRKTQKPQVPLRVKALELFSQKLGTKESPPESNRCWATVWYGQVGPWCAMSVSWAYVNAGSKAFSRGRYYAYVPYIVGDARAGRNGLTVIRNPQPGDLVCYDWNRDGVADHVGLFEREVPGGFTAVEGNTSVGNDSNGGEVMRRNRQYNLVQVFVHVSK